jgi:hypothetical protein
VTTVAQPRKAVVAHADAGVEPPGSDRPSGIGKAATRALPGAGLPTLERFATRTEAERLAPHGVGPEAVRILADTLRPEGMSLS